MPCFCEAPITPVSFARMNFAFSPPAIPLSLRLAAALGLGPEERADLRLSAAMSGLATPSIAISGGPLLSLAGTLSLAAGRFSLLDPIALRAELAQTASTIGSFVLPRFGFLLSINPLPVLQLALVARLKLAIPAAQWNAALAGTPAFAGSRISFALTPPQLSLGTIVAAIPSLLALAASLGIALDGSGGSAAALSASLSGLASLSLPALPITIPAMLQLAALIDALATIEAAFGVDAMTPSGLAAIAATLRVFLALPLPSPLPDLSLMLALPPLDAVTAGFAAPPSLASLSVTPPAIAILPFLSAALALRAALQLYLGVDPWDFCGAVCQAPLPNFF